MTAHAGKERSHRPWAAFAAHLPTRAAFAALAAMLFALAIAAFVFAPPAQSQGESAARYTGVASCAGSTCHGRMEGDGTIVRQDELMTWQEPSTPVRVEVGALTVTCGDRVFPARLPRPAQEALLSGAWDATGLLLDGEKETRAVAGRLPYVSGF